MAYRTYYLRDDRKVVFNPNTGEYSLQNRGRPLICLVSARNREAGTVKYGYAILHPEDADSFSKAEGVVEALKKMESEPLIVETTALTGHDINKSIVQHFSETIGKKNNQARKLSRGWLKVAKAKTEASKKEV